MEKLKGWIILHILCYLSEKDKEINTLIGKDSIEDNWYFSKTLIKVSNIVSIDLEYSEESMETMKGKCYVGILPTILEVKETPEQVIELIRKDYDRTN